jgi:hypothetical protein
MSQMIWNRLLTPPEDAPSAVLRGDVYSDIVEDVRFHPWSNQEIEIPDPKAFRSMSRASLMTAHVCWQAKDVLAPYLARSPFSVGIYCAVENGPIDAPSAAKILGPDGEKLGFAEAYRKFRNPKMYLKQLPNLVPAQMGIFMGLQGPMNVYTHSREAGLQALEQAEWDLAGGMVEAGLICTAHAFDDFLVVKRTRQFDRRTVAEGAAALVLVASPEKAITDWSMKVKENPKIFYGISDKIISVLNN